MANFASFVKDILQNNDDYFRQPKMIKDMIQVHNSLRDCKEFNKLQTPILSVVGGFDYTEQDIILGLQTLKNNGYSSFVFAERSTYCLKLLHDILRVSELNKNCPSCSISSAYDKVVTNQWGDSQVILGVIIKLTDKRACKTM